MWKPIIGRKNRKNDYITVVSGLPRSGTSMMMNMLEAGGMEVVVDHLRKPDDDNPNGYYELETVKKIKEDHSWLDDTHGKVFKMISMLLYDLPKKKHYRILFMERNLDEILISQKVMLQRNGNEESLSNDKEMKGIFETHIKSIKNWISSQKNMNVIYIDYNKFVDQPYKNAKIVNHFLANRLNIENMVRVLDKSLYRNRV